MLERFMAAKEAAIIPAVAYTGGAEAVKPSTQGWDVGRFGS